MWNPALLSADRTEFWTRQTSAELHGGGGIVANVLGEEYALNPADFDHVVTIPAGIHYGYSVTAAEGTLYVGEPGAILDGQGSVSSAFKGQNHYVGVDNLEIRNYNSGIYIGAVTGMASDWYNNPYTGDGGWKVARCNIHHNNAVGVTLQGNDASIRGCKLNYNGQEGFKLLWGNDQIAQGNEIAYSNYENRYNYGNEAGACKNWETTRLILDNNYAHDNNGMGLWTDHGNRDTVFSNNVVVNHYGMGIFHEISYGCEVYGNTIINSGMDWTSWIWGAGIMMANAGHAVIYDNHIEDCANGITFSDQNRGYGPLTADVYNNTVINSRRTGNASDAGNSMGPYTYVGNHYEPTNSFYLNGSTVSEAQWKSVYPGDVV